jgi:Protein of unknown function (DUF3379)
MMTCLEFRRRVGAEPFASDAGIEAHRSGCPACARHQDELRSMDDLIKRALAVELPRSVISGKVLTAAPVKTGNARRRLFAIAASLVAGVTVGIVLLVSAPRASIAREVFDHVMHEQHTMAVTTPMAPTELAEVLDPDGTRIRPDVGDVTFAARCPFDGHVVPHLVVRTPDGAVTVLMLRHREISKRMRIAEQGFEGVVLPAPRGSIAIVGKGVADIDGVAKKVFDAVDWGS